MNIVADTDDKLEVDVTVIFKVVTINSLIFISVSYCLVREFCASNVNIILYNVYFGVQFSNQHQHGRIYLYFCCFPFISEVGLRIWFFFQLISTIESLHPMVYHFSVRNGHYKKREMSVYRVVSYHIDVCDWLIFFCFAINTTNIKSAKNLRVNW